MRRSTRSPLAAMMRRAHAVCAMAARSGASVDHVLNQLGEAEVSPMRRQVIGGGLAAAAWSLMPRAASAGMAPKVVIVGAGLAGLACAEALWRERGIAARIYEWDDRLGGRVQTLRGYFANGQVAEQHGEFISSEHTAMLNLARAFGLKLENTGATPPGAKESYWVDGARYTQQELNQDWWDFGFRLFRRAAELAPNASFRGASPQALAWDRMSVTEWVDRHVPGGASGRFGRLCLAAVISEYGGPPDLQSALNLIYILGFDSSREGGGQSPLHPNLAGTDEKWRVAGGADQITAGLAARLPKGAVELDCRLIAIRQTARGQVCTFERAGAVFETVADHVVLTLPFTTLRQVDLSACAISPLKRRAISDLPLGSNVKVQIQVAGRPWLNTGWNGDLLTDAALGGGWDTTLNAPSSDPSATAIFDALPGGSEGLSLAKRYGMSDGPDEGPAPAALVADTLAALEPIFPGVTAAWTAGPRRAWVNNGNLDPHLLGAWSQYNLGQYTGFGGVEGLREGNLHFAGEHTSRPFQGFMEGAVRSGRRAAAEI